MPYTLPAWQDSPSTATPISSANLLLGNTAIQGLDSRLGMTETGKLSTGLVNAKGKLISSDNSGNPTALLVGTDGQVLTADSTQTLGLRWVTASAGGGVPTSRVIASGTGLSGGGDLTADRTFSVTADTTTQRLEIAQAGTLIGTRKRVNFIQGANVTLTTADNSGSNQVDVTIASSGASGSPDATTTVKGIVQLAGDLAGTAASPTINATGTPSSTTFLRGDKTWATPAGGGASAYDLQPCRAASVAAETWPPSGAQTRDGVSLVIGDRFLYKDSSSSGGIWTVNSGAWTRSADMAAGATITNGITTVILEGTKNKGSLFKVVSAATGSAALTIGTTALAFLPPQDLVSSNGTVLIKRQQIDVIGNLVTTTDTGGSAGVTQIAVDTSLAPATSPVQVVFTTKGDLVVGGASGAATRLARSIVDGSTLLTDAANANGLGLKWSVPNYSTVKTEGTAVAAQTNLNFIGAGVTVTNNTGTSATDVTIPAGGSGIPTSTITTLGDLIAANVSGVATRLPAGANTMILFADNTTTTGLRWDVPPTARSDIAPVTLTDATFVDTNASLSSTFRLTLGGNRNLRAPTAMADGQKVTWELIQDATGSRTMSFNAVFVFGAISSTLTTTAGLRDFLTAIYNTNTAKWYVLQFSKGY